jgi:hypothetical protein
VATFCCLQHFVRLILGGLNRPDSVPRFRHLQGAFRQVFGTALEDRAMPSSMDPPQGAGESKLAHFAAAYSDSVSHFLRRYRFRSGRIGE